MMYRSGECNRRRYLPQGEALPPPLLENRRIGDPNTHVGKGGMVEAPVLTFQTTHHALWAEEIARERGIPAEVVPAPPAAGARCNLALETLPAELPRLVAALQAEGIPHAPWPPAA